MSGRVSKKVWDDVGAKTRIQMRELKAATKARVDTLTGRYKQCFYEELIREAKKNRRN